ncbi:MAG: hypothetical protein AAF715_28740 [Myxococcota bacterium]
MMKRKMAAVAAWLCMCALVACAIGTDDVKPEEDRVGVVQSAMSIGQTCGKQGFEGVNKMRCIGIAGGVCCNDPAPAITSTCVDWDTDPNNCGGCGVQCAAGDACVAGVCVCEECGTGSCVDLDTDPNNCGECGEICDPEDICFSGNCTCPSSAGYDNCSGNCISLGSDDPNNCGSCGTTCTGGKVCTGGSVDPFVASSCECPTGETDCSGTCVDLSSNDPLNCGACGNDCSADSGSDGTCSSGTCTCGGVVCGSNQACVGGSCVSTCSENYQCAIGALCNKSTGLCQTVSSTLAEGSVCDPGPDFDMDHNCDANPFMDFLVNGNGLCVDACTDPSQCGVLAAQGQVCNGSQNNGSCCPVDAGQEFSQCEHSDPSNPQNGCTVPTGTYRIN